MRNIVSILLLICFVVAACDKKKVPTCIDCPVAGTTCVEGECQCPEGFGLVNNSMCVDSNSYVAYFDDWYCMSTFAITIGLPSGGGLVEGNRVYGYTLNPNNGSFYGTNLGLGYWRFPDGDSIAAIALPPTKGGYRFGCEVAGGECEIDLRGKFRSPDTLDATLKLACKPTSLPDHGNELKVVFVKYKKQ
jgi:hypothetical protein